MLTKALRTLLAYPLDCPNSHTVIFLLHLSAYHVDYIIFYTRFPLYITDKTRHAQLQAKKNAVGEAFNPLDCKQKKQCKIILAVSTYVTSSLESSLYKRVLGIALFGRIKSLQIDLL